MNDPNELLEATEEPGAGGWGILADKHLPKVFVREISVKWDLSRALLAKDWKLVAKALRTLSREGQDAN